jgi:hypothetical protein
VGDETRTDDDVSEDADVGPVDIQISHQRGLAAPQLGNRFINLMKNKLFVFIAVFLSLILSYPSLAQSPEDPWSDPINLSHSGSTTDPAIIVDNEGITHVVWQDAYAGFIYSKQEGVQWSEPALVDFPFDTSTVDFPFSASTPQFYTGSDNYIHAFWLEDSDFSEEVALLYSRVVAENFGSVSAWQPPVIVAQSATTFAVDIDDNGGIHVAYIRPSETSEFPAGIYYRRSNDTGITWLSARLLNQSPYFRSLSAVDVNISIASLSVGEVTYLYLTWDNLPRKRVYLMQSKDGGANWEPAIEVDSPEVESGFTTPFNIMVTEYSGEIILKWQVGEPRGSCNHYYQLSLDGGVTWSERQPMMENIIGCAQDNKFFTTGEGILLLQTTVQGQVYLLAWDGIQWSDPQLQRPLTGFVDPETFRTIDYGCRKYGYHLGEDRLVAVGCELGEEGIGIGDTWTTSRQVGDVTVWYPPPSIWSNPVEITSNARDIRSPVIVSDRVGFSHLFWAQEVEDRQGNPESYVYYASKEGDRWSRPLQLFSAFSNHAGELSVTMNDRGNLLLTWNDMQNNEVYFSWSDASRAYSSDEWAPPSSLPVYGLPARSPKIYTDNTGTIYVAYVIPLNEGRGLYLTLSEDHGETWSDPIVVFDAESAGWEGIGLPNISGTVNGNLYLQWAQSTLPDGIGPVRMNFASSNDGGATWTEPEVVIEAQYEWSSVLGFEESVVHRLWQESSFRLPVIRHQVSYDGGLTWNPATSISSFGETSGTPGIAIDGTGRLHLVQVFREEGDQIILRNWQWDGEQWGAGENIDFGSNQDMEVLDVVANILPDDRLEVVLSVDDATASDRNFQKEMLYSNRYVGESPFIPIPVDNSTSTPSPTIESSPMPISTPTTVIPTPTESRSYLEPQPTSSDSRWQGIIYGGVIAGIIVLAIFALYIYRSLRSGREK